MPAPRKSAKLLSITGSFERNPKRRRKDVEAGGEIGPWRKRSTDPRTVWRELVSGIPAGILTRADRQGLELAVHLLIEMRTTPTDFPAAKCSLLLNLLGKLGCLPASRLGMAPDSKENDDPSEKYFR